MNTPQLRHPLLFVVSGWVNVETYKLFHYYELQIQELCFTFGLLIQQPDIKAHLTVFKRLNKPI